MKKDKYNGRTRNQLRILKCFMYNEGHYMSIEVYDKKTKKMYCGVIGKSNWSLKDKLQKLKEVNLKPIEK
ncbi:MAG TPA: hypothetical protein VMZ91_02255 [Candidatus Paceibacterota bacterium]|nr:hypothetical protein [Candidatus Paceibacterota bacterium]